MIKIERKLNDVTTVVVEGENHLELFEKLSSVGEVFGEECCGKCKQKNIQFRVRTVQDGKKEYKYPELVCVSKGCYARLAFGSMEGGMVFPVRFERKDGEYVLKDGKRVPKGTNGWTIYNKETGEEK